MQPRPSAGTEPSRPARRRVLAAGELVTGRRRWGGPQPGDSIGTPAGPIDRYGAAFFLIVATIVAGFLLSGSMAGRLLANVIGAATLVFVLTASDASPALVLRVRVVALAAVLGSVIAVIAGSAEVAGVILASTGAAYAVVAPVPIVRRLVTQPTIRGHTVMGALCLYLLLGLFFAYAYAILGMIDGPFFVQQETSHLPDFLYFSFVTQGTIGYGDLTARTDAGRLLAVAEGIAGQLYLVTVVAVVVGNFRRTAPRFVQDDTTDTDAGHVRG